MKGISTIGYGVFFVARKTLSPCENMPQLHWIGKEQIVKHHFDVPLKVLQKSYNFPSESNSENMLIHGDNLEALKALIPYYEGKIKCVYIDPPYNTGNESRVYNDNVNHPKIKKWLHSVVGKEGEDFSRHDKWLCMMYPRLQLLHKLLREDGVIFISIDDNEQANLKLMMDEIFGASNFIGNTIRQHSIQPKGYTGKFSVHHNHTIIYRKSPQFELLNLERTDEHNTAYGNPDNDPRGMWRTGDVRNALYRPNLIYNITTASGKTISPPDNGRRRSKETLEKKITTGEIIFNADETRIIRKIYLSTLEGRTPETIRFGKDVGTTRDGNKELKEIFGKEIPFETPKPTALIDHILKLSTQSGDIVLDSFAGSGTTAHAVLNLNKADGGNRKFILIELEDYAERITAERLKRVIQGYGNKEATGGDFCLYSVGETMFDEDQNLNPLVSKDDIRRYIRWTETRSKYQAIESKNPYFLGSYQQSDYYFYYEPDRKTEIDYDFLATIQPTASNFIILYADVCSVSLPNTGSIRYIFKKIPRDITKL